MNVGDYVRTLDGIMRVIECRDNRFVNEDGNIYFYNDMMCNPSSNIIDLIEVGDYVNGHRVIYTIGNINKKIYVEYVNMDELLEIKLEQITSIVTKEQFESMEYKVGD